MSHNASQHKGEPDLGAFADHIRENQLQEVLATRMYAEVVHHQSENLPADVDKIVEALYAQSTRAAKRMRSLVAELESGRMPPSSPHRRAA
jgi:hypothetical protein